LKTVITAAIARELSGFVWAIAKQTRPERRRPRGQLPLFLSDFDLEHLALAALKFSVRFAAGRYAPLSSEKFNVGPPIGIKVESAVGALCQHPLVDQFRQIGALETQVMRHFHRAHRLRPAVWRLGHLPTPPIAATMRWYFRHCNLGFSEVIYPEYCRGAVPA
jgi:hypothetical protein